MKNLLATVLLIGFVSLAVFGFAEMASTDEHANTNHRTCLASAVQGIDCPNEFGNFGSAFFHIAAFKFFSTITLETALWLFAILALVAASYLVRALASRLAPTITAVSFQPLISHLSLPTTHLQPLFLSWLALKELSPTQD